MAVMVLALSACAGGVEGEDAAALGTSESALSCDVTQACASGVSVTCSSVSGVCTSGADSGGWVECDGARTYCPPACTCGTARYTTTKSAQAATCGLAFQHALSLLNAAILAKCPAGSCNRVETLDECTPVGPNRTDGFRQSLSMTYSCNEPANCK
ncbi:hypothetical protein DRW03_34335 [Corallococcus sp. H22C18031201]|nr:hypothetical protein DRW03_34335 [Corallococcus sp. H22C18031201]